MNRALFAVAAAVLVHLLAGTAAAEPSSPEPGHLLNDGETHTEGESRDPDRPLPVDGGDSGTRPLHLTTPFEVQTEGGTELRLPPGYYLTEDGWDALDREFRRLQERVTRAEAERDSLADSLTPGWGWLAWTTGGVGAGIALTCWLANDPPDICVVAGVGW